MAGYTKLFHSILHSTIWREPNHVRIVWITLLAMAGKDGIAEASIPGLSDAARIPILEVEDALQRLQQPDAYSRSGDADGRRLAPVDGGWRLINHGKYRAKMSADERREYLRVKQAEHRKRKHAVNTPLTCIQNQHNRTEHNRTDPEQKKEKTAPASLSPVVPTIYDDPKTDPFLNDEVTRRAGAFVNDVYPRLYREHRKGARYAIKPVRDYAAAVSLCSTWDDARLEKLAIIFLNSDHKFAEEGSRTVPQFLALASWCDGKLCEHEAVTR